MAKSRITYSQALADEVCALIAAGHTMASVSELPGCPAEPTMWRWRKKRPGFEAAYREACDRREGSIRRGRTAYGAPRRWRPVYSPKLAERICLQILEGASLSAICKRPSMPSNDHVHMWLRQHADFRRNYAIACDLRCQMLADEVLEIADQRPRDAKALALAKQRIAQRMWLVNRLQPRNRDRLFR
jgi:hypothetical protein